MLKDILNAFKSTAPPTLRMEDASLAMAALLVRLARSDEDYDASEKILINKMSTKTMSVIFSFLFSFLSGNNFKWNNSKFSRVALLGMASGIVNGGILNGGISSVHAMEKDEVWEIPSDDLLEDSATGEPSQERAMVLANDSSRKGFDQLVILNLVGQGREGSAEDIGPYVANRAPEKPALDQTCRLEDLFVAELPLAPEPVHVHQEGHRRIHAKGLQAVENPFQARVSFVAQCDARVVVGMGVKVFNHFPDRKFAIVHPVSLEELVTTAEVWHFAEA